jgi:hypothetical protein
MACLIMTLVSKISANIFDSKLLRTAGLTKIMPFGVTLLSARTPMPLSRRRQPRPGVHQRTIN